MSEGHPAPWLVSKIGGDIGNRLATVDRQAGVGPPQVGRMPVTAEPGLLGESHEPATELRTVERGTDGRGDHQVESSRNAWAMSGSMSNGVLLSG